MAYDKDALLAQAHLECPMESNYPNTANDGNIHGYVNVYCNSEQDVLRCKHCGTEVITRCDFDDDYS